MSSASVNLSNREKNVTELGQELESLRATNSSLRAYLGHLRSFKKNLAAMNDNCKMLSKVNSQWIQTVSDRK